jgi:putative membrane protein
MIENMVLYCGYFYNTMDWGHMSWWGFPFFALWFIGFFIVIIVIVYVILHSEKIEEQEIISDAQKILDERYAKGEMTRQEYIQAKDDLKDFKPK